MDQYQNGPDLSGNQQPSGQPEQGQPYTQPPYYENGGQQQGQADYQQPGYQPNYDPSGYQPYPPQPEYSNGYYPPIPPGYQQKSKIAAGLLGIFLGSFGVHNFYLGYTGKAVAQLLITLLTCGIGSVASGIWGFIEGIMILTDSIRVDGNNIPLRN